MRRLLTFSPVLILLAAVTLSAAEPKEWPPKT